MKQTGLIILLLLSLSVRAQTIKVAAAANLRLVLEEIKKKYEIAHPRTPLAINFGSSGVLLQQILSGADFDLFLSADTTFPIKLKEQGLATGEPKTYCYGKLVLWSNSIPKLDGLDVLTSDKVKHIAIAKPDLAPYGDRAIEVLKKSGLFEKVKDKIVYADNISQTAQFAQSGNAEVAFLAYSLTFSPEMKGSTLGIDPKLYKPIEQSLVLVKNWKNNPEAAKLVRYILSDDCRAIFQDYGYLPVR